MFEQDYIMRLIKEMIRTILKLLFNIDTDSPTMDLLSEKEQQETMKNLLDMINDGKINEAENALYELTANGKQENLEIALLFYSYLNDKEDDFLELYHYRRDEIKIGLEALVSQYGLSSIVEIFLTE